MNILLLTKKNPWPPNDGEAIAILQMAKGLAENGHSVSVLFMNTPKHNYPLENIPADIRSTISFHEVWIDNNLSVYDALVNLFSKKPYHAERFYKIEFEQKLKELLATPFDIIQCEGLYLTAYIPLIRKYSRAKIIYRSHNIESNIWKRFAAAERNIFKKKYLELQSERLLKYETAILHEINAVVPISVTDAAFYKNYLPEKKIKYSPTGINEQILNTDQSIPLSNDLYFLGALDWLPNRQGLLWFIKSIFPHIIKLYPEIQLHVAGRNAPADFASHVRHPNIRFYGEVANAAEFVSEKFICLVPLLAGSGMKIKIPEAMAQKKLVVTTVTGAEGLPEEMKKYLIIAASAGDFAQHIIGVFTNRKDAETIAANGYEYVRSHLSNNMITRELTEFYQSLQP